jgi:hypothetical protein
MISTNSLVRVFPVIPLLLAVVLLPAADALAGAVIHAYGTDWVEGQSCGSTARALASSNNNEYRQTIFLNFDGATLTAGGNDSRENRTSLILSQTLEYPAMDWKNYGGREKGMAAVVQELEILFLQYSVEFVTERPLAGDYTMVMVGGRGDGAKKGGAGTVGIAPLDCKNTEQNDLALVFGNKISGSNAKSVAYVIAHEMGHTFGLEHVSDQNGIMYPALNDETCCWVNSELAEGSTCGRAKQDDTAVLKDNVGLGPGDIVPPKIWFRRPGSGAVLPGNFSVEVLASDDLRIHHVELLVDGEKRATISSPPYSVSFVGLSDGVHTIRAEVFDWKPNTASAEIVITVDQSCIDAGVCHLGAGGSGEVCATSEDCTSGTCAQKGELRQCVERCDGVGAALCPAGTSCTDAGGTPACTVGGGWIAMPSDGGEGGCNLEQGLLADSASRGWSRQFLFYVIVLGGAAYLRLSRSIKSRTRRRPSS